MMILHWGIRITESAFGTGSDCFERIGLVDKLKFAIRLNYRRRNISIGCELVARRNILHDTHSRAACSSGGQFVKNLA